MCLGTLREEMEVTAIAERPHHVPPGLVVDIDCLSPPGWGTDTHLAWYRIKQANPPIFWTPRNGGHWIATKGDYIRRMQVDTRLFSHSKYTIPHTPEASDAPPASSDAPLHAAYRALIAPALRPDIVRQLESEIRQITQEAIAAIQPRGECEFIADFAQIVPITMFLRLVELPESDRPYLLALAHRSARPRNLDERISALAEASEYLAGLVAHRRAAPGPDMFSMIVNGEVDGRAITVDEALKICRTLMFGGLDTVASMQGFFAMHLARAPSDRRRLVADPELIPSAVEELIRRFGVANSARMVTRDIEFEGVALRAGDQVLLPNSLVGLDDMINPSPLDVDFDRPAARRHAAFGNGAHACPGAALARLEMRIFLEEWLSRIPEFGIAARSSPVLSTGFINSVASLHLEWEV